MWHRGRCCVLWRGGRLVGSRRGGSPAARHRRGGSYRCGRYQKLAAGLLDLVAGRRNHEYVAVRLGAPPGVWPVAGDSGGPLTREELFAGWRMFFENLAAECPVIWLIEDAQHADTGLLDFVDYLVDWARDLPIYLLVFSRPELDERQERGFGVGRNRDHAGHRSPQRRSHGLRWWPRWCRAWGCGSPPSSYLACRRGAAVPSRDGAVAHRPGRGRAGGGRVPAGRRGLASSASPTACTVC